MVEYIPSKTSKILRERPTGKIKSNPAIEPGAETPFRTSGNRGSKRTKLARRSCTCNGPETEMEDIENFIRCSHRDCPQGWFHLQCMGLSDHPPRKVGWFCPDCRTALRVKPHTNGLIDSRDHEHGRAVENWLAEERQRMRDEAAEEFLATLLGGEEAE